MMEASLLHKFSIAFLESLIKKTKRSQDKISQAIPFIPF